MFTDFQDYLEDAAPPGDATSSAVIVMGGVGHQGDYMHYSTVQ